MALGRFTDWPGCRSILRYMADTPFARFREIAINRQDVFPAIRFRQAWLEYKSLFSNLINGPVWNAYPGTLTEWEASCVPRAHFAKLALTAGPAAESIELPASANISLPAAFGLLEQFHDLIRRELEREAGYGTALPVPPMRDRPGPLPPSFRRMDEVGNLMQALQAPPAAIAATLVHGSLADGLVAEGFSDADVLCLIQSPVKGAHHFWEAARWLFKLNHRLFAVNPCMHHGPMIVFASEIKCAAEASVPSAIIRNGFWCHGGIDQINYHDGLYEGVAAWEVFEFYFEAHHLFVSDLKNAFDALWWTSNILILPILLHQTQNGRSIYKRDCLVGPLPADLQAFGEILAEVSAVRLRLGQWINSRLPAAGLIDEEANPGAIVADHRDLLRMTPADIRSLGLDDALMRAGQHLWDHGRTCALAFGHKLLGSLQPVHPVVWRWPRLTTREPHLLTHQDYDHAREVFLSRASAEPAIKAVFEFGEVGCPGLSDLDFCVILDDEYKGSPSNLQAAAFPEKIAYIMDHDPLFVSSSMAGNLAAFFPIFSARQLYGPATNLPLSRSFDPSTQAAAITHLNLRKYPRDLDWLIQQPAINVRTILAFLHSAQHVAKCLGSIGLQPGEEIQAAVILDRNIRRRFLVGQHPSPVDLFDATRACMAFCAPLSCSLTRYWMDVLQQSGRPLPPQFQERDMATRWVRGMLSSTAQRNHHFVGLEILPSLSEYIHSKQEFCNFERARNREPSVYMEDASAEHHVRTKP
jgi:hypothetical protein